MCYCKSPVDSGSDAKRRCKWQFAGIACYSGSAIGIPGARLVRLTDRVFFVPTMSGAVHPTESRYVQNIHIAVFLTV